MPQALLGLIPSVIGGVSGILGSRAGAKQSSEQMQQALAQANIGNQAAANQQGWNQFVESMGQNPATFMQNINKMTPTLNAALVSDVTGPVYDQMAQMGLAGSPGQMAAGAQTNLAPFMQQNQMAAIQAYLNLLQQPGGLNQSLMNYGGGGANWLPKPPSGAGGFGSLFSGLGNLFGGGGGGAFPGFKGIGQGSVAAPSGPAFPLNTGLGAQAMQIPQLASGLQGPVANMQFPTTNPFLGFSQ